MGKSVRVNLSLPPEVAEVVSQVARETGRSMSGVVMEALAWRLPYFRQALFMANHDKLFPLRPEKVEFIEAPAAPVVPSLESSEPRKLSPAERLQRRAAGRRSLKMRLEREKQESGVKVPLGGDRAQ